MGHALSPAALVGGHRHQYGGRACVVEGSDFDPFSFLDASRSSSMFAHMFWSVVFVAWKLRGAMARAPPPLAICAPRWGCCSSVVLGFWWTRCLVRRVRVCWFTQTPS